MQKHVLMLATSAFILACGGIAANAQQTPGGPMQPDHHPLNFWSFSPRSSDSIGSIGWRLGVSCRSRSGLLSRAFSTSRSGG